MKNYIYILKRNLIGETIIKLRAEKVPFQVEDIIYIAGKDKKIHSRWQVTKRTERMVIIEKKPENAVSIKFEKKLNKKYENKVSLLEPKDANLLEKYFIHKMKIFPFYDLKMDCSVEDKILSELREKDYKIEVYTNVLKSEKSNEIFGNNHLIISEDYGIMTFRCVTADIFTNKEKFMEFQKELKVDDIIKRLLLNSSILTKDGIDLKIPYKRYYIAETNKDEEYYNKINKALEEKKYKDICIVNTSIFIRSIFENINRNIKKIVEKNEHFGILQMLMPQYIISKSINMDREKIKFMPEDSYEIDENQKSVLAQMNERIYLKAAAGSGKTILLLAKAYEVAIANPKKEFLIMCYNNKLAEDIRIQAENTGKIVENLKICTLDKFIQDEITKYGGQDNNDTFRVRREIFVESVKNNKYTKKFGGIFLDEMQQLEEKWIAALLDCLDDNKYMVLAGDYYQQIRLEKDLEENDEEDAEIIEENADDGFYIGKYKFKKIILDRNYRNTDEIVQVVNKMLKKINMYIKQLNIPIEDEERNMVMGKGLRKENEKPKYINVTNEKEEIEKVVECLLYLLKEREYTQNEILLLSPWGKSTSHLVYLLKKEITENNIGICDFEKSRLTRDGVRLGTIGRAIGLDFKAVIIYGTNMLQSSKEGEKIKFTQIEELQKQKKNVKKEFIKFLKNVYVACSRARDTLIIIDDIKNYNLISEFLKIVGEVEDE